MAEVTKTVVIGADDVYPAARAAYDYLSRKGFTVIPMGALVTGKVEPWPEVAWEVARKVASGEAAFGVVVCYTGTGVSIAANKIRGIRAALCNDARTAQGARLWNDANVLAISGRLVTEEVAREILDAWLSVTEPDPSELANIAALKRKDGIESDWRISIPDPPAGRPCPAGRDVVGENPSEKS